jgi:hypothetical protein
VSTAIVAVEGVLRDHNRKLIFEGKSLVEALNRVYKVVLALDANDVDATRIWLQMEGVKSYQDLLPALLPTTLRGDDERVAQVNFLRGRGEYIGLLVDSHPGRIEAAFGVGIPSLLFAHPGVMRPEFRPDWDQTPTPWAELVAEIETGRLLASQLESPDDEVDD